MRRIVLSSEIDQGRYGAEITILKGKYKDDNDGAWVDLFRGEKGTTKNMVYCMILLNNGTMISTPLKKTSVTATAKDADTFEEAVLQQQLNVLCKMNKLAELLAACQLHSVSNMCSILEKKVIIAEKERLKRKDNLIYFTSWKAPSYVMSEADI